VTTTSQPGKTCGAVPVGTGPHGRKIQTIVFPDPGTIYYPQTKAALAACATSGLALQYSADVPDVCTIDAAAGVASLSDFTCTVTASQPGNAEYEAAAPVSRVINLGNQPVELEWGSPLDASYPPGTITVKVVVRSASPVTATLRMAADPYDVCSSSDAPSVENATNPTVTFLVVLKDPPGGSATCTLQPNIGAQFVGASGVARAYRIQR
jgi:hypothetical protein